MKNEFNEFYPAASNNGSENLQSDEKAVVRLVRVHAAKFVANIVNIQLVELAGIFVDAMDLK